GTFMNLRAFTFVATFLLTWLITARPAMACQCPLTALNQAEIDKYDIIFKGKILSVKAAGKKSEAVFEIGELYKGLVAKEFTLL
ncbi:hypothetical protein NK983_32160, partial [Salmonella enterica subsp. enterica serovar Typhimurium]|nr:hypothetical protein [Salmonella enterica subsp. enterica serovar Typhimurium]